MLNSNLKLQGLTLEEIICNGVHGQNPEITIDDWQFIEYLYNSDQDKYEKGYEAGVDATWRMLTLNGEEEE